ncbi:unnamed protein product [Thlaspi arvense]|uniref:Uncharacterized protein n=1 Tax=Thlaspi arvense TaxID=13288 RepID=A0AAU9SS34_THLAR|nr:unnamed protein product [Thlaspi arvense]
MATAIFSSRFDHEALIHRNPNSRLSRHSYAATTAPRRCKRSPTASQSRTVVVSPAPHSNLVMGQVKILKRGETLSAFRSKESGSCVDREDTKRPVSRLLGVDLLVASANRLGPEPEIVQKQIGAFKRSEIVAGVYAGAGSSVSPHPSSVPIPCFLGKKNKLLV